MTTLGVDVGNSSLKFCLFRGDEIVARMRLDRSEVRPTLAESVRTATAGASVDAAGVSCVVPEALDFVVTTLQSLSITTFVIDSHSPLPFTIAYTTPGSLGADRIAAAAGAIDIVDSRTSDSPAVIVVDVGTAVTVDVVSPEREFMGGMIGVGPRAALDALLSRTSQLAPVPLVVPERVIGTTTIEAIQSGVMLPFIDGLRGAISRTAATLGTEPWVVLTGGDASAVKDHLDRADVFDRDLVLRGVRGIVERERRATS